MRSNNNMNIIKRNERNQVGLVGVRSSETERPFFVARYSVGRSVVINGGRDIFETRMCLGPRLV